MSLHELSSVDVNVSHSKSEDGDILDPGLGWVMRAAVMPESRTKGAKDPFRGDRPLIDIL
jgi:hypothetical protein